MIPLTEKRGILHYTISWDPNLAKENKLVLSHQAMVDENAYQTLSLAKTRGMKRVAFLHMEETGFNLGAKYIQSLASVTGIELIAGEAFPPPKEPST